MDRDKLDLNIETFLVLVREPNTTEDDVDKALKMIFRGDDAYAALLTCLQRLARK